MNINKENEFIKNAKRKSVKATWMRQRNARYTYCQEDTNKYHMGSSVHVDVR